MAERARRWLLAGGVVIVAGAVAAGLMATGQASVSPPDHAPPPTSTFTVEATDLTEKESFDADLGYAGSAPIYTASAGTITWLPDEGSILDCGGVAYRIDDEPVAYLCGAVPAWRNMSTGTIGPDVQQLEDHLRAAGYASAEMDADGEYTWATARAVRAWQEALGAEADGVVDVGEVVFGQGARRVGGTPAAVGARVDPGQPVLDTTSTWVEALVTVPAHSRRLFAEGTAAAVELPDGTTVDGTVASVRTRTATGGTDPEAEPIVEAVLTFPADSTAHSWDGARAAAEIVSRRVEGVLAVPVAALTATAAGSYAVEVVDESAKDDEARTTLREVSVGMFADGMVEISGEGLHAGLVVVIPS